MKRPLSLLLAFLMTFSPLSTMAEEPANSSDVLLQAASQSFAATVPTGLPVELLQNGQIIVATNAQIINNSKGPIKVSNIAVETKVAGWSLADFSDNFTLKKVGSKELGLQFRGDDVNSIGDCLLNPLHWPTINGNDNLALIYDGKLAAQRETIEATAVANVVFTLGWDVENGGSESSALSLTADKNILAIDDISLLTVSQSEPSNVTWENSNPSVAVFEDVRSRSGAIQKTARAIALGKTTIKVTDELGRSASRDIIVVENELVAIKITQMPNKTTYNVGDVFSPTGMKLKTVYKLGHEYDLRYYDYDETPIVAGQTFVLIRYEERGVTKSVECPISVTSESASITELLIDTPPNKTQYIEGNNFNPAGMIVKAKYDDGSERTIANYTLSNNLNLTVGQASVSISHGGRTVTQSITVTVKNLIGISITNPPNKTSYIQGNNFNSTGMVVSANYNDSTSIYINDYTIVDGNNLAFGKSSVTINYNGKTTTQAITVADRVLAGIAITTPPTKTDYVEDMDFDSTGMIVTATYSNGTTDVVTPTLSKHKNLTKTQTFVGITYGGITVTQDITVRAKTILGLSIKIPPNRTSYIEGNTFDGTGMVVMATYDNGRTWMITPTFGRNTNLTVGQTSVDVSCEGETITQAISVAAKTFVDLEITTPPNKTAYIEGNSFNSTGMIVNLIYDNVTKEAITNYTVSNGTNLVNGQASVTVVYNGLNTSTPITVTSKVLNGISITTSPIKTVYQVGEDFDTTGMVVRANYNNETSEGVTSYTHDGDNLKSGTTEVTITYNEKTAKQSITLSELVPEYSYNGFTYNLADNPGKATITGYTGAGGTVVVPATINSYPVILGETKLIHGTLRYLGPFAENQNIKSLSFQAGVEAPVDANSLFHNFGASTINLAGFDTSKTTNMNYMFSQTAASQLDLSPLNVSNVTSMATMFSNAKSSHFNFTGWNTSKVTNMGNMFQNVTASKLDLTYFNTRNVTNMSQMFIGAKTINYKLNSFDISNVKDMNLMFCDTNVTTLDLKSFRTNSAIFMGGIFQGSTARTVYAGTNTDVSRFEKEAKLSNSALKVILFP